MFNNIVLIATSIFDRMFSSKNQYSSAEYRYLSQAVDLADLEVRQKNIQRNRYPSYYV